MASNMWRLLPLAVVLTMGAATAQSLRQSIERFELFNNCETMDLLVEELSADATRIGLSEQRVQAAVESRLRSARLYDPSRSSPYLYVNVTVVGAAYRVGLYYYQRVLTLETVLSGVASTWTYGLVGTHGRDASHILSGVSEIMDIFLSKYLRVNEEAC